MEKEKFDLQKKHTENIQELLEDTNTRLSKMEAEYVAQNKATVSVLAFYICAMCTFEKQLMSHCNFGALCNMLQISHIPKDQK